MIYAKTTKTTAKKETDRKYANEKKKIHYFLVIFGVIADTASKHYHV